MSKLNGKAFIKFTIISHNGVDNGNGIWTFKRFKIIFYNIKLLKTAKISRINSVELKPFVLPMFFNNQPS